MKNVIFEALNTKTIWSREIAILKPKWHRLNVNLVTVYNTIIKNLQTAIRNNSPILYSDPEMKNILPEGSTNITYKRGKSLRELISPSMFPSRLSLILLYVNVNLKYVTSAKTIWSARMNLLAVTGKTYKVGGKLCCTSSNVIYLISCKICKEQ